MSSRRLHHIWIWSRWVTPAALKFRRLLLFLSQNKKDFLYGCCHLPRSLLISLSAGRSRRTNVQRKREMKSLMNQSFNWPEVENGPALEFLDVWRINLTEINLKTFSFAFWDAVAFITIFHNLREFFLSISEVAGVMRAVRRNNATGLFNWWAFSTRKAELMEKGTIFQQPIWSFLLKPP